MTHQDYVFPSRRDRFIWLLAGVVVVLMLTLNKFFPAWFEGWLKEEGHHISSGNALLLAFVTVDLLFFAIVGIVVARAGYLILTKDRWPPLGFPMPMRAKVLAGSRARALGVTCVVLATV